MKKWGGQLDIRPPHSKNWGGRVPPIPPGLTPLVTPKSGLSVQQLLNLINHKDIYLLTKNCL